ncbi:hypothetical protein VTH06DRAFT_7258 [Thermothelomyces fergusii]
MAKGYLLVVN